jgi:hypothetical protein
MTAPVKALYFDPWQGQCSSLPAGLTVQPMCVQIALKATVESAVGRATMPGLPSGSFTEAEVPTAIESSVTRGLPPDDPPAALLAAGPPAVAEAEFAPVEAPVVVASGAGADEVLEPDEQAARAIAPTPAAEAVRTVRRVSGADVFIDPPVAKTQRVTSHYGHRPDSVHQSAESASHRIGIAPDRH